MKTITFRYRLIWFLALVSISVTLAILAACGGSRSPDITPTPTRTPHPTATPTPSPTPTPVWPVTLYVSPELPQEVRDTLESTAAERSDLFTPIADPASAEVRITLDGTGSVMGDWFYAVVAPFPTLTDDVAWSDVMAAWRGEPTSEGFPFAGRTLLVDQETHTAMTALLGPPAAEAVAVIAREELLATAWAAQPSWGIVPFHQLEPRWKVLSIDGQSVLARGLASSTYPLRSSISASGLERGYNQLLDLVAGQLTNRDEERMTVLVMTGVTALTRGTAQVMETSGVTYPAQDIGDWLREADLTHVSNEVSFTPDCPVPPVLGGMTFCSHDRYIELLDAVEVDIIELTGNHLIDHGIEPFNHTLELYRQRGWEWFGGGANLADATWPLTITHGVNNFAFLGCNPVGPAYDWATETSPGSAPCDWDRLPVQIAELRDAGYLTIVTIQAYETYEYFPTEGQVESFRSLAEAGATIVQGSQAHQPQSFDFYSGAFIDYGLGNLFFDQMQSLGTRQEFIDRHVFYDGRHLSVELLTAMLEEYARPRPMTEDERRQLLESVFAVSGWVE